MYFYTCMYACIQLLRSLGDWSGGLSKTERSVLDAYIDAIDKAEHFIYIEVCM